MLYFVNIVCSLVLAVEIYSAAHSPRELSSTVSHDANSPMRDHRTFDGDVNLLRHIYELADEVNSTSRFTRGNLNYSSCLTNVRDNKTPIMWQDKEIDGPEVTLFEFAVRQLVNTTVKFVVFEEKNKSQHWGDIVTVKTASLEDTSNNRILRIKFEKKKDHPPQKSYELDVRLLGFWNIPTVSKWSVRGIKTKFEAEFIICIAYHLSTFSILFPDPDEDLFNDKCSNDSFHQVILTNITRIGSGITICFLILVIRMNYYRKNVKETRKILLNSSVALLLTHGTYQTHIFLEGDLQCLVLTFMKYYFALAYLLWTVADGINMWRILLVDVFNTKGHIFYQWFKIIAWGLPVITTSIGLLCIKSHGHCNLHINKTYDYIFYMIPWVVILSGNMLLFTWTFINITNKNRLGKLKNKDIDYVLALTQVFGISWCVVFPLLYFELTQLLGEYLLAAIVSTQGLLIFIVRGGIDKNLKNKLKERSSHASSWFRTNILKSPTRSASRKSRRSIYTVEFHTITESNSRISYIVIRDDCNEEFKSHGNKIEEN